MARLGAHGLVGAVALAQFAWVTASRIGHPFGLEWQEGAMLEHARRLAAGLPIYVEPGLDFAPFPYPPLFHGLGALALTWFPGGAEATPAAGLLALRAVSVMATLVLLVLVAVALSPGAGLGSCAIGGASGPSSGTARDPRPRAGDRLLGAGLVAAGAGFGGWFLDLARVDALALALTLAAVLAARAARTRAGALLAALVAAAAVLTKQTALLPCAALVVPLAGRSLRLALAFAAALGVALAAAAAYADAVSDGWATFTVLDVLAGSPWHRPMVLGFWREAAVAYAPVLALAALAGRSGLRAVAAEPFGATAALGLVLSAWVGRAHEGGFDNTLLPLVVAVALVAPRLVRAARERCGPRRPAWAGDALGALAVGWLVVAGGDPSAVIPTAADVIDSTRAVAALAELPAPAFVPDAPDLAERAGHPKAVHAMAIVDLLKSGEVEAATKFVRRLEDALRAGDYGAVVLDAPWDGLDALEERYVLQGTLDVPAPRTGAPRVPRLVYVRR